MPDETLLSAIPHTDQKHHRSKKPNKKVFHGHNYSNDPSVLKEGSFLKSKQMVFTDLKMLIPANKSQDRMETFEQQQDEARSFDMNQDNNSPVMKQRLQHENSPYL